ncbi:hypothetical protein [Helicovermis profundi]|uniref:Uncharacterized protein n=1 Tax=Helicovermis profundi TaxID=3065157 RepID=A0AAU9EKR3_9FIRM|nr:hypothetical protein HLPR_09200 [Clostridia bacterium S502]
MDFQDMTSTKKPIGISIITFLSLFQIMFSVVLLLIVSFIFIMNPAVGSTSYNIKESFSNTLFNLPSSAIGNVHLSIIFLGTLIPAIIIMFILRYIKKQSIKGLRSVIFIKIVLDVLRMSAFSLGIDIILLLLVFKNKNVMDFMNGIYDPKNKSNKEKI